MSKSITANTLKEIGKRIASVRHSKNMTQEQLAELLDVTPKHISSTESGFSSFSLKTLMSFCSYLNCSLDYIISGSCENITVSKLPSGIASLLYTGDEEDIERLNDYLKFYLELKNTRKGNE